MLEAMHAKLKCILQYQTKKCFFPLNSTIERVIGRWHKVKHPSNRKVKPQENEPLRLCEMGHDTFRPSVLGCTLCLNATGLTKILVFVEVKVAQDKELSDCYCQDSENQTEWFWILTIVEIPRFFEHPGIGKVRNHRQQQGERQEKGPHQTPHPRK